MGRAGQGVGVEMTKIHYKHVKWSKNEYKSAKTKRTAWKAMLMSLLMKTVTLEGHARGKEGTLRCV